MNIYYFRDPYISSPHFPLWVFNREVFHQIKFDILLQMRVAERRCPTQVGGHLPTGFAGVLPAELVGCLAVVPPGRPVCLLRRPFSEEALVVCLGCWPDLLIKNKFERRQRHWLDRRRLKQPAQDQLNQPANESVS